MNYYSSGSTARLGDNYAGDDDVLGALPLFDDDDNSNSVDSGLSWSDVEISVLDVETTGRSPEKDRVIEIAVVRIKATGEPIREWHTLVNPEGPVGATEIHGITDSDVVDAPLFSDIAGDLLEVLDGSVIAAHNAQFDTKFIKNEFGRLWWEMPETVPVCTMESWNLTSWQTETRKLADCCAAVGVELTNAHAALYDTRATAELLQHILADAGDKIPVPPPFSSRSPWPPSNKTVTRG